MNCHCAIFWFILGVVHQIIAENLCCCRLESLESCKYVVECLHGEAVFEGEQPTSSISLWHFSSKYCHNWLHHRLNTHTHTQRPKNKKHLSLVLKWQSFCSRPLYYIESGSSSIATHNAYPSTNNIKTIWMGSEVCFHVGQMCLMCIQCEFWHCVDCTVLGPRCFPNFMEGTDSTRFMSGLGRQMHGDKWCLFNIVTNLWQSLEEGCQKWRLGMWVSIATCFFVTTKFKVEIRAEWHVQTFFVFVHVTVQSWESQHYMCCSASCFLMV